MKTAKTVKALVCEDGFATKGELVVGGSVSAVGATSRKLVRLARVVEVPVTVLEQAADAEVAMFPPLPGFAISREDTLRTITKTQQRLTKGLVVGTLVKMA